NQDGSCIQSISIILNQDPKRQVTLTHSGDVLIYDQYKINLPYADGKEQYEYIMLVKFPLSFKNLYSYSLDLFEIRKLSSVFLQVKTRIGLQILYDREGLRLYLQADGRWKDDTVGLCGTFNGNMEDDFLYESPVGVTESTPQLFGNAWKTSSACILVHDSSQMDPCDIHLQSEVCFIWTALSCEDTKEYSTCVSTCGRTCQALSVPETCSSDCVEGCACPFGTYLNSKTERCVDRNECPCYFQGIDYPPGDNVITSLGKCHCSNGVMNCDNKIGE
ncbi:hypothetical protein CIB84_008159, partial [Bambusicola thoracicus]